MTPLLIIFHNLIKPDIEHGVVKIIHNETTEEGYLYFVVWQAVTVAAPVYL